MGFWTWVLGIGAAGWVANQIHKSNKEDEERRAEQERRKNTPCFFVDGFSRQDFIRMVKTAAKKLKRITDISVDGPVVSCTVESQSGISEWEFTLDFNDYGHITGRYWLSTDNSDSSIPDKLGDMIKSAIDNYPEECSYESPAKLVEETCYCPSCGKKQSFSNARFCVYCGNKIG